MTTTIRAFLLAFIISIAIPSECLAYKEDTHELLSGAALKNSEVGIASPIFSLINPALPDSNAFRFADAFIAISQGAQDEDNFPNSLNHFYNPISGHGLPLPLVQSSPDWIIDGKGQLVDKHFYKGLWTIYYDALTKPTFNERKAAASHLFLDLGHVIHHVQDMAQPQHTRSDDHCDIIEVCLVLYRPSAYERFTNERRYDFENMSVGAIYSKIHRDANFSEVLDFWRNEQAKGQIGMAEYSNRYFVTVRTNFLPCSTPQGYCLDTSLSLPNPALVDTEKPQSYINSLLLGSRPISRESLLTITIAPGFTLNGAFTLDEDIYQANNDFLIPRAISYSAGLINFFFRVDLDARVDANTGRVLVKNPNPFPISGVFRLFFDSKADGTRQLAGDPWSATIAASEEADHGPPVPVVSAQIDGQFILVFQSDGLIEKNEVLVAGKNVALRAITAASIQPVTVTLAPNATQQFGATIIGTSNVDVTWTATGGTITSTGLFTAGATAGTFIVRATSVAAPSVFGEATVTITSVMPAPLTCTFESFEYVLRGDGTITLPASVWFIPYFNSTYLYAGPGDHRNSNCCFNDPAPGAASAFDWNYANGTCSPPLPQPQFGICQNITSSSVQVTYSLVTGVPNDVATKTGSIVVRLIRYFPSSGTSDWDEFIVSCH